MLSKNPPNGIPNGLPNATSAPSTSMEAAVSKRRRKPSPLLKRVADLEAENHSLKEQVRLFTKQLDAAAAEVLRLRTTLRTLRRSTTPSPN